jgi:hypothetical protein
MKNLLAMIAREESGLDEMGVSFSKKSFTVVKPFEEVSVVVAEK